MKLPITIAIADSSPVFRYGLRNILDANAAYNVIDEIESGEALEAWLKVNTPDLLVMDCLASGFSVDTVVACARLSPHTKLLAITSSHSGQSIVNALRAGITSYVKKDLSLIHI